MRILHYPFIRTQQELDELYHRACWYLPDMHEHTVVFAFHDEPLVLGPVPDHMGVAVEPECAVEYATARDNPDVMRLLNRADYILLWRDDLNRMEQYNLEGLPKRLLNVSRDSELSRHEAYHSAILRHELMEPAAREQLVQDNHAALCALAEEFACDKAYVFGTGPSLELAEGMDFSDGTCIVCNTAVRNTRLLQHLQPRIIVAADPALHFGVSCYAAAFRECVQRAMVEHDAWLLMPMGYYPLFVGHYPELAARTIGVPVVAKGGHNISVDLCERFQIACYANILTLFLLPLGATIAREVGIVGCDGRVPPLAAAPEADDASGTNDASGPDDANPSPFWKHHEPSEFEELYETLKICHPSFFMMDYAEWYDDHCAGVRLVTEAAEAAGRVVRTLTPSYIPALTERLEPHLREECEKRLQQATPAVSDYVRRWDTRVRSSYRVSVIVSMYGAERFVAPMLENLLDQTLFHRGEVEILLIDSASPTHDLGPTALYLESHEHILYARTRERETVYAAFNRAIRESRGTYIMNLDTDNRLRNDALELFADALDAHPQAGLVYGNQFIGQLENESFYNHVKFGRCRRPRFSRDMMLHKYYFGSELMWRKSLHDEVGYYDTSYVVAGDYEMVCRLARVTDFLHLDRYFGLYLKNLGGVEYTNLELCDAEDTRIRDEYGDAFPRAVDPPRVHVHYPIDPQAPNDYMTIVCHTMSLDKPVTRSVRRLCERLEFPFILYSVDQNSSQATLDSIDLLKAEGLIVTGDALAPRVRRLFECGIAYRPTMRFVAVVHGETEVLEKNFLHMKRPELTAYFRGVHKRLSERMRSRNGQIDPLRVRAFTDYHEFERLDMAPHTSVDESALGTPHPASAPLAVCIQHYAPTGQERVYRQALTRCIHSIRSQPGGEAVQVIVSDDGSHWSRELAGSDPERLIAAHGRESLQGRAGFADIDADLYLYKPRTGYFSKGILWNAALEYVTAESVLFMDDDHHFLSEDALNRYLQLLERYELVVGNTRSYVFRDDEGVRHTLQLGYESPVVQGSNFAVRLDTLRRAGGFDPRTFLWGTGDDPALFWKLYLQLRPLQPGEPRRACYAETIVTENPYSGRWREDCRVEYDLFLRDFLRQNCVHPNANPSRDRTTWMDCQRDEGAGVACPTEQALPAAGPELTMVVLAVGADFDCMWRSVAAVLDQRLCDPHEVVVAVAEDAPQQWEALLSASVRVVRAASDVAALRRCAATTVQGEAAPYVGWLRAGDCPAEKMLKGALTALRTTQDEEPPALVCGWHGELDRDGFAIATYRLPVPGTRTIGAFLASWRPGQPVVARRDALERLLQEQGDDPTNDSLWDVRLLLAGVGAGMRAVVKGQYFALRPYRLVREEATARADLLAEVLQQVTTSSEQREAVLQGVLEGLRGGCPVSDAAKSGRGVLPWYAALQQRLDFLRDTLVREDLLGRRVSLCGDAGRAELVHALFWPRGMTYGGCGQETQCDVTLPAEPSATAEANVSAGVKG